MASCPKELERNGPTKGMIFTRQQAEKLFQRYLNKKLSWFESGESGLNNLIFFLLNVKMMKIDMFLKYVEMLGIK
jgi:hypothetical protein